MSTRYATGPVSRLLLRHTVTWQVGMWVCVSLVFTGIGAAMARWGSIEHSVWEGATTAPRWGLFVSGILLTSMFLPFLVASGITRRTFAVAGALTTLVLAAGSAVVVQAGYLVERAIFAGRDLPQELSQEHLFGTPVQVHLVLTEYTLLFAAYLITGWLIGYAYYRFGWLGGTLFLPLTWIPAIGVDVLLSTGWSDSVLYELRIGAANTPAAIGLSLVVIALGLATVRALTSTVAIKPRTT